MYSSTLSLTLALGGQRNALPAVSLGEKPVPTV